MNKKNNHNIMHLNNEIFLSHSWKKRKEVIQDVISTHPEESFCFLNEQELRKKVQILHKHFLPWDKRRMIAYAIKANPRDHILKILNEEDISAFDCASINEIETALKINRNADILFNHPIKRSCDISKAASHWVHCFTVQSKNEIKRVIQGAYPFIWNDICITVRMATPNVNAKINLSAKFWISPEKTRELIDYIQQDTCANAWISMHTGSQNEDYQVFKDSIETISQTLNWINNVRIINIWWWIPVNIHKADNFSIQNYLNIISKKIRETLNNKIYWETRIVIELWRAIIAEAIDLVVPILSVEKWKNWWRIYINDGLFTSFSDKAIHNWQYPFELITKDNRRKSTQTSDFTVFWRTCDSWDLIWDISLPGNMQEWDFLRIPNAWAYMDSQSTNFNGFDKPKYVIYNS